MIDHKDHKITLNYESGKGDVIVEHDSEVYSPEVGDNITFSSKPPMAFKVKFENGSNFSDNEIADTHPHVVERPGGYEFKCFYGDPPIPSKSGGNTKRP